MKVRIGDRVVGEKEPVFVIAEAGSNHDRKLEQAKKLIDIAAEAGADAVKFQTFSADRIVARTEEKAEYMKKISERPVYEIFKSIELPREWHWELAEYAEKKGIIFLSSPFDKEAVDLLDEIGVPAFKVASGEITNFPLLKYIAKKKKPIILSTGAATMKEIAEAVSVIERAGNKRIILLHCVASYPAPYEDVNLLAIEALRKKFKQFPVGYSDHTLGIEAPLAAVALGAKMIEKHFTISRSLKGPDHFYALEPDELKAMVNGIRLVEKMLEKPVKEPAKCELEGRKLGRRSIFARVDIPAGSVITEEMLTILRPNVGIEPRYLEKVIGRRARKDIRKFEPLTWEVLE